MRRQTVCENKCVPFDFPSDKPRGRGQFLHLYQGRFKSFPVQEDDHLYAVLRYVERNPLRAGLVRRAEDWRWCSLAQRQRPAADRLAPLWHRWPLPLPRDWLERVNRPETEAEVAGLRQSVGRGRPYGSESWQQRVASAMDLEHTFRKPGRPKKAPHDKG